MEMLVAPMLIAQCDEVFMQVEDAVFYIPLEVLNIFSLPLASLEMPPSKEQVLDSNHVIKQITCYFHGSTTFCARYPHLS